MGRFLRNNRGMALILTILIISLIVALTLQFNTSMRSDLYGAVNLRDGIRFGYIVKSGFHYALAVLFEDSSEGNVDSLLEAWADTKSLSENSAELFGDDRFKLTVSDHSGMIQINKLLNDDKKTYNEKQKGLLTRFLQSEDFGLEDEDVDNIVNAIKDWIDEDDDPTGLGGAENSYYQGLEAPYSCKNAPVEFLEELQRVRWIKENKELYERISPYVSPHGDDGKINLNTAHPLVLRALSDETTEDPEMVENMDEYRNDEDNDLKSINWDDRVGMREVNHDPGLLTTSSTYFEIVSEGQKQVDDKEGNIEWVTVKRVTAMVQRKEGEFDILSWKIE